MMEKGSSARAQTAASLGVNPGLVQVGADVIELVTSGMYVSPVTIYREYVQNAADAIDAARSAGVLQPSQLGTVSINIDHAERRVSIRDNGTGIPHERALAILLSIGGSPKRGTDARGFRGVGRLSGLAYCRELQFRTSALGQSEVSTITIDCRKLRSSLSQARSGADLREIVANAVDINTESVVEPDDHFFEVTLKDVARHRQDILLNERHIAHYLGQVAPVPFDPAFSFADRINSEIARFLPDRQSVELSVNGERVTRPFRDALIQPGTTKRIPIDDIEFFELANVDGEVGGIGWLGHHDYVSSISTSLGVRGLRARVGDVQIGEANLFDDIFKESRFNGWTIGEVHILDRRLLPNGRRDNFEVNHHSYNLLVQLGPIAARVSQRCRTTSVSRNASLIIRNTLDAIDELLARQNIDRGQLSRSLAAVDRSMLKLRAVNDETAREDFRMRLGRAQTALSELRPADGERVVSSDAVMALVARIVTNREQAAKLVAELQRLGA
jgi:molecular chaperone HtpG